ncbi:sugar phosphate isomerase/epimerase family protein [Parasphingorhabdus sp. DH2-15]|uniref:sugar phosphate isomerase/epimerase family protein n=1 Tax=Parasphingorhabdus sp. DH2-15 TaxID=3444112 RepID=UPI003F683BAC
MTFTPDRRTILAGAISGGAVLMSGCSMDKKDSQQEENVVPYTGKLGVQLYTVRALFEKDYQATLKALADIGIKDCETAGFFAHKPTDVRKAMDDLGLISNSGHVQLADMREDFDGVLELAEIMGQRNLFLPWIAEEERTLDGYRAIADLLNERGEQAKKAGMTVGYHNHEFEFLDQDGSNGYDILLERTEPSLVSMEIDLFWLRKASVDPFTLFDKAPGRFIACHIKDMDSSGNMVDVGSGEIDFSAIFNKAAQAGLEYFYIEHDDTQTPIASVGRSYEHLTA